MHINSTEYLKLIATNECCLVLERAAPRGRLKRDMVTIKAPDGRNLSLSTPSGFRSCPVEIPWAIVDDFLRASLVAQDGPAGEDGTVVFRLTDDGRTKAAAATAR